MGSAPAKADFNARAFVSTLLAFGFVTLATTGLLLLLWPGPRGSHVLGLAKPQCTAIHEIGGLLVITTVVFHVSNNWKTLTHHLRRGVGTVAVWRREWLLALLVLIVAVGGTLAGLPPFSLLVEKPRQDGPPGAPPQGVRVERKGRH